MSSDESLMEEFRAAGAVLNGHFLLSSGLHSDTYVQCAKVMEHPERAARLCKALAEKWPEKPTVVAGPAMGGILVGYELARALGARSVFFERVNGEFALRRGFALEKDDRVLVGEDVVTTGGSVKEVIDKVKEMGGNVVGVASFIHRGKETKFDEELRALLTLTPPAWKPEECPLCKEGSTPVKPGSRPGGNS